MPQYCSFNKLQTGPFSPCQIQAYLKIWFSLMLQNLFFLNALKFRQLQLSTHYPLPAMLSEPCCLQLLPPRLRLSRLCLGQGSCWKWQCHWLKLSCATERHFVAFLVAQDHCGEQPARPPALTHGQCLQRNHSRKWQSTGTQNTVGRMHKEGLVSSLAPAYISRGADFSI